MIITRWNPSTNGAIHLGHVYSLLVNERFAHRSDGRFYVRFDDNSPPELALPRFQVDNILNSQQNDIEWLEVPVDVWQKQSYIYPEIIERLEKLGHKFIIDDAKPKLPYFVRMGGGWLPYPYVPQQTAERVVMDNMLGITHVIRGDEFATEFSLYRYFCGQFGFVSPEFIFLPRLMSARGDISKTAGGYTIKELRGRGYTAQEIKNLLAKACLFYPYDDWTIHNLRPDPKVML